MKHAVTFWAQVVSAVIVLTAGALWWGQPGFNGALLGTIAVVLFFGSTVAIIGPIATWYPALSLAFALLFYLTKAMVLAAMFYVLATREDLAGTIDHRALAGTLIFSSIIWITTYTIDVVRRRTPTYDLPESTSETPDTLDER